MLKELRTFIAVARHGTFSRTAGRVGLTQSAVSSQIQRLEESLGFALFDRIGRNAVLNAAGQETLARAGQLVALFEQLHRQPGAEDFSVPLRIGAIASVQCGALPGALARLRQDHPQMRLRIVPGVSLALLGQVDAAELDAAVMIRPPFALPPELAWHPLWDEPFVLAVPAAVAGDDWRGILATQPFLRYDHASFGGRRVAQFLHAEGIEVQDAVEMDELDGIVRMVALGLGVALLPHSRPRFDLPAGVRLVGLQGAADAAHPGPAGETGLAGSAGATATAGFRREIGLVERIRHPQAAVVQGLRDALRLAVGITADVPA